MNLVIVESPAKGKTIEKYLGPNFKVLASFGHVRDLPASKLGIEIDENFTPAYVIPPKAKKVISKLKEEVSKAETLYLATDYDREGEAIAYHLVEAIKPKSPIKRITFTEITEPAIKNSIKNPREIDMNLVDAQQARRVLDRLVGYKLSPFLWRKVAQGLSAGRVQSVAVRLVVEREREIQKFIPEEYWSIEALLDKNGLNFTASLTEKDEKRLEKLEIKNEKEAKKITDELENADYIVKDIAEKVTLRTPPAPYTTSTLQQDAGNKLHFSAKQTMLLAQNLYEDGLITYMRTDSVQISPIAANAAKKVIEKKFGSDYVLEKPRFYKTKSKGAQEAHEAIRPTDFNVSKEKIGQSDKHAKLYDLIWKRAIASQMKEAKVGETRVKIKAGIYGFTANGVKVVFDGFLKVSGNVNENLLPELKVEDTLKLLKLDKNQHLTEAPARYSEGSLIKELEKRGIGRPSTYAPTLSTIQERGYVEKVEGRFVPKDIGFAVNDILVEHFPKIVDYNFTAQMEEELDEIAEGKLKWQPVIKNFYEPFNKNLKEKMETVSKSSLQEETDEVCPKCGKKLVIKLGRFGKFLACSGFPDCKYTRPLDDSPAGEGKEKQVEVVKKCPKCGKNMIVKESRYGKFLACEGYPECKHTEKIEIKSKVKCPNCGGDLVMKRTKKGKTFWGCSNYPKCKTAFWKEPKE